MPGNRQPPTTIHQLPATKSSSYHFKKHQKALDDVLEDAFKQATGLSLKQSSMYRSDPATELAQVAPLASATKVKQAEDTDVQRQFKAHVADMKIEAALVAKLKAHALTKKVNWLAAAARKLVQQMKEAGRPNQSAAKQVTVTAAVTAANHNVENMRADTAKVAVKSQAAIKQEIASIKKAAAVAAKDTMAGISRAADKQMKRRAMQAKAAVRPLQVKLQKAVQAANKAELAAKKAAHDAKVTVNNVGVACIQDMFAKCPKWKIHCKSRQWSAWMAAQCARTCAVGCHNRLVNAHSHV